jgi:hypothetical protein
MKNPDRALSTLLLAAALAALPAAACAGSRDQPQGTETADAPARRDAVVASGVLSREKDCQLLRTPTGQTYVLIGRLTQATAGARIRVSGRRGGRTACRQGPSILVEAVRPEELEPAARQPGDPVVPGPGMVRQENHHLDEAALGKAKPIQVTGLLTREGVECPVLRTPKGGIFALAGDLKGFKTGERVTVTGTLAEASICQQGTTIDVREIGRPK